MNISLPAPLKSFIEKQVAAGGYEDASEYVEYLVLHDQRRRGKDRLEQSLIEAMEEGDAVEATPEWLAALQVEVARRVQASKNLKSR